MKRTTQVRSAHRIYLIFFSSAVDQLEVSFEFQEPQETDFHSLKQFTQSYLHGTKFDHSGLADYVLALVRRLICSLFGLPARQAKARHIGSVLKVKESLDGETFGFISVICVQKTRVRICPR